MRHSIGAHRHHRWLAKGCFGQTGRFEHQHTPSAQRTHLPQSVHVNKRGHHVFQFIELTSLIENIPNHKPYFWRTVQVNVVLFTLKNNNNPSSNFKMQPVGRIQFDYVFFCWKYLHS